MEPERVVDSTRIFEGKVLSLRIDEVISEDGHRSTREVIEHRGAVAIVCIHDGDIWLVRQYRHPTGEVLLEIPAGTLGAGEDPAACASRELVEEVGLRPQRLDHLVTYYTTPGITNEKMHIYFTDDVEDAERALEPGEVIDIVRKPVKQLRELIASGDIVDAKSMLGLSLVALRER
jgi:ADP-ribose pyrophosphatase